MTRRAVLITLAAVLLAVPFAAEAACPCVPATPLWTMKSCDSFACASSEFMMGNGEVIVMPTGSSDAKFIVMQRVPSGTMVVADPIYNMQSFDNWSDASVQFASIATNLKPMFITTPDGMYLIVSRNFGEPRRHAVGR